MGSYELFARILAAWVIISTLRFELALILPKKESEAMALMKVAIQVLVFVSLGSGLVVLFFSEEVVALAKNDGLKTLLPWLPLLIFLSGLYKVFQNVAIRSAKFSFLSSNKVLASASNHGGKALIGFSMPTAMGLLIGHFIGLLTPVLHFLGSRRFFPAVISAFRQPTTGLWKKYRDFPLINTVHVFSDEAKNLAMFAIVSIYYGEVVLGLFGLMIRYLRVPIDLFGNALGSVFMQTASERLNEGKSVLSLVTRIIVGLILAGILPFGVIFFFGEPLFGWFFGEEWVRAGMFASIISPWLFAAFVVSPISSLPVLVDRQKTFFLASLAMNGSVIAAMLFVSISGYSIGHLLGVITFVHVFFLLILLLWFIRLVK
jgi:O-antigen/teichoic acid export membrane protein